MPYCDLKLVTKADAADVFSVSVKTIDNYIKEGRLPKPVQFSSKEYWHPEDFKAFLDQTFRRLNHAEPAEWANHASSAELEPSSPKPAKNPRAAERVAKDSSPVVRQQARQDGLLKRLNGAA